MFEDAIQPELVEDLEQQLLSDMSSLVISDAAVAKDHEEVMCTAPDEL